jgi:branched-chain amino acid transport system permease protein
MVDFLIFAVTIVAIWSVVALSLDLQFGLTGLVNFGQILPFALGAYGAAVAALHGLPMWSGIALGLVLPAVAGLLVLLPVGRLSQDYWALVTLGAAEIFRQLMVNVTPLAGGQDGASVPRIPDPVAAMCLALALLVAVYFLCRQMDRSPLGRFLRVIREDEMLAATLGRNPFHYQAVVTVTAWIMAGAAGVLYGHFIGYVAPSSFTVAETFVVWTALILGGPGSLSGAIVGTAFVQLLSVSTRFFAAWSGLPFDIVANLRLAFFGLVLILVFLLRREGLFPERMMTTHAVRS